MKDQELLQELLRELLGSLRKIVDSRHLLTVGSNTERCHRGFGSGQGDALCVVQSGTLLEQWLVVQACVAADMIVIMQAAGNVEDIIALDIALKRNERSWFEELPPQIIHQLVHKLHYGHFMCHVMLQDYIIRKGADIAALKASMLDQRGAEYPAEHNVGHLYKAKPDLAACYKSVYPTNSMNPGIGNMSKRKYYA